MKTIISGGGTGGHVYPAIAIADKIKELKPGVEILFVGAKGKFEMEKVPQAGYPIEGLDIRGFDRSRLLKSALTVPFKLIGSLLKARRIIKRFQPDVVIGVGGYASGPTLEMATRLGIPTLIQEQNSYAGVTNKLLAKKVDKVCVAYSGMEKFFPQERIQWTGNPVRSDILTLADKKAAAFAHFGLEEDKPVILAFGGSLGARTINESFSQQAALLKNNHVQVIWQAGKLYIKEFQQTEAGQLPNVKLLQFIDRMDLAYAAADVIIGRAGALTVSELCLVGKPAILVPSPMVAEDHQTKNAMALVNEQAALMIKDEQARSTLLKTALELLGAEEQRKQLSKNIKTLGKPNAAKEIAAAVIALANG